MKRLMFVCVLLLAMTASAAPGDFKGTWEGTLALENHTRTLTLMVDEATKDVVRGRLLQDGEEFAPISEGKIDADRLTFRADTIDVKADRDGDRLSMTLSVSHGKTFQAILTRKQVAGRGSQAAGVAASPATRQLPRATSENASAPPAKGALLLVGGGANVPQIVQRFSELAGGHDGSLVVIPTADEEKRLTPERMESLRTSERNRFGVREVTVLHTRDRAVADSEELVEPLQHATGVWMLGGDAGYLLKAYRGTRVEREMRALFERGGVVGGTSAGAIAQTAEIIGADGKTIVNGFGLLRGVLVWPHWSERHDENDLVKYTGEHPGLLGIGIDEATAIMVQGHTFEVIGAGNVGIVDGKMHDGRKYYRLARGDRFDLATRALVPAQSAEAFEKVMAAYDPQQFGGAVLVARDGDVLFRKSNTPMTKFRIGSLTKQFTAAAILVLEERGKLRTSNPIKSYLPESPPAWDGVTIYHLLTHTSGIPNRDDILKFPDVPLGFRPGEEWTYSNAGYQLLGRIVERVSGKTYAEFVTEAILAPLGMRDTGADPELADLGGAGSLVSTVDDLLRWQQGLFGGKLLTPASFTKMTTPFRNGYGCALRLVISKSGRHVFANEGRVKGFNATLQRYDEDKLVVIVLANLDTQVDTKIASELAAAALSAPH